MISMGKLRSRVELLLVLGHTGYNSQAFDEGFCSTSLNCAC
jgi:hypothetical protein